MSLESELLAVGGGNILLVPVIRGLVSEGDRIRKLADGFGPEVIALSISPEELKALREHDGKDAEPLSGTVEENVYEAGLAAFGDVKRPPRCFVAALDVAKGRGVEAVGVDLTEEEFTRAYCQLVSGWDFVRRALGRGRFSRGKFEMSSAEAFVLDWDRKLRKVRGYDSLEKRREAQISRGIGELSRRGARIMALVEVERVVGVLERLRRLAAGESS
jgi:hypothetical protein